MQVNSSEMTLITEMSEYSKMHGGQEIMINSSSDHDYRVINGTGGEVIKTFLCRWLS